MPITRRQLLVGGAGALVLAACSNGGDDDGAAGTTTSTTPTTTPTTRPPATALAADPFGLGVASGDPEATSVVLWTRLLGAEGDHDVLWEVLRDGDVVAAGVETATPDAAHTVHAVAGGLEPGTVYRYRFTAGEFTSPVGRTRTAGSDRMRFAFASCQNWQNGLYTAHAHLAAEEVDLVLFLGDYIYEGGVNEAAIRQHDGDAVTTLDGYRARYALYRSDPNLQAAHASAPWFVVWDDHEVLNNYSRDVDPQRQAIAYRAWWEHQPTRLAPDAPIHRTLEWGDLVTFVGLDGRRYRDDQPCDASGDLGAGCPERDDPTRTMLGAEQEAWVADVLPASTTTWNVLANQTIFSPAGVPVGDTELFNLDQWDGYPAARDRMLDVLAETNNAVIVTGDIHAGAVGEVRRGDDVVAVELVGPAISSSFPAQFAELFESAATAAGAKMVDALHNGYVVCEVTEESLRADYRVVSTTREPTATIDTHSSWVVNADGAGVEPL